MKDDFKQYLLGIGLSATNRDRAAELYEILTLFCPEAVEEILVSEYVTGEGVREYETLLFLTPSYVLEVEHFLTSPQMWFNRYTTRIDSFRFNAKDYDFKKAVPASRLSFWAIWTLGEFTLSYKASGENCDHLRDVVKQYIAPNLNPG